LPVGMAGERAAIACARAGDPMARAGCAADSAGRSQQLPSEQPATNHCPKPPPIKRCVHEPTDYPTWLERRARASKIMRDNGGKTAGRSPLGDPMTLGNMRALGLALLISLASCLNLTSEARAGVTYLYCSGTLSDLASKQTPQPWTMSLTLDTEKQTMMLDGYKAVPYKEIDRKLHIDIPSSYRGPTPAFRGHCTVKQFKL
jgi:hypothetical protein